MNRFIKAAKAWDVAAVGGLLDENPDWSTYTDRGGRTALHYTAARDTRKTQDAPERAVELADMLVARGADIDAVHEIPDDDETFPARPVWYAYARGANMPLVRHLLARGANPNSCLWATAWNDDTDATALFLKHGAVPDERFDGETPFLYAYRLKRFAAAEILLAHGADVDAPDADGNTALHLAILKGFSVADTDRLLRAGANPARLNGDGEDAIALAERLRRRGVLKLLNAA